MRLDAAPQAPLAVVATQEYFSVTDVCRLLNVSRRTVYNWIAKGKLARLDTPGGSPRFAKADLLRRMHVV